MTLKHSYFASVAALLFLTTSCGGEDKKTGTTEQTKTEKPQEEIVEEVFVAKTVGELMVELESNMGWESVTEAWKTRREGWVTECYVASDIATKSNLLLEFEGNVQWSAVSESWANIREAWSSDCINCTSDGELADLLVIFESYVIWDVVSPNWVNLRGDWITRCEAVE